MPSKRPTESLTVADRLVTALIAGACGFGTMLFVWLLVMFVPFYWTGIVAGVFAAIGFLVGPERAMNGLEHVWWLIGQVLGWDTASPSDRRKGRF